MRFDRSILTGLLGLVLGLDVLAAFGNETIYKTNSPYNSIIVQEDSAGLRYLLFSENGALQSVRRPGEAGNLVLPYSRSMMVGLTCVEKPRRILVVGLGGASIPSYLHQHYPKARIDCVEIDSAVIDVAKRFFGFQEDDRLRAHAADGRKYIEETTHRYDIVFLDAFGDDYIPPSLTTREFLLAVRRVLSPRGIVLANVWGRFSNPLYDSMLVTYRDVFKQVYLFDVPLRGNIVFLAVPRTGTFHREDLAQKATAVSKKRSFGFDLGELVRSGYQDARELSLDAPVLLDPQ
jgi:spermidine synthase